MTRELTTRDLRQHFYPLNLFIQQMYPFNFSQNLLPLQKKMLETRLSPAHTIKHTSIHFPIAQKKLILMRLFQSSRHFFLDFEKAFDKLKYGIPGTNSDL